MNFILKTFCTALSLGLLWASLGSSVAGAADTNRIMKVQAKAINSSAVGGTPKPAAADPAEEVVTLSTFVVPRHSAEGRDPFFPNSLRVYGTDTNPTNKEPKIVADLTLKGISGTPEQPLAIINTTTFTTGESSEVITKTGRMRVMCVEINMTAGTVLLQIGAERRELRLAPPR